MWALMVVAVEELIEARLLLQEILRGRPGGLFLERQVHALMTTILLRMAGLNALEGKGLRGGGQGLAAQQVAAGEVADGEREAIAPIGEHELAFVVRAPQIVGLPWLRQRRALSLVASLSRLADQAVAIEHRMHGAD